MSSDIDVALEELEGRLERLRALYEQYFIGIEKIEPAVPRQDVDRRIYALRKAQIRNTAKRFKLQTIIQRYNAYQQYWLRICREIENGTYHRHVARAKNRFGDVPLTAAARRRARLQSQNATAEEQQASTEQKARSRKAGDDDLEALLGEDLDLALERVLVAVDPAEVASAPPFEPASRAGHASLGGSTEPDGPGLVRAAGAPNLSTLPQAAGASTAGLTAPPRPRRGAPGATPTGPIPSRAPARAEQRAANAPPDLSVPKPAAAEGQTGAPRTANDAKRQVATAALPQPPPQRAAPVAEARPAKEARPRPAPAPGGARPDSWAALRMPKAVQPPAQASPSPARGEGPTRAPRAPEKTQSTAAREAGPRAPGAAPGPIRAVPDPAKKVDPKRAPRSAGQPAAGQPAAAATGAAERGAAVRAGNERQKDPLSAGARLDEQRLGQLHGALVAERRRLNQPGKVSKEALAASLRDTESKLRQKYAGKAIDFHVVIKDGKAVVKPIIG